MEAAGHDGERRVDPERELGVAVDAGQRPGERVGRRVA